jgi:hypothetical protein
LDIVSFNTLLIAISEKKETIDFLYSRWREFWMRSRPRAEAFLHFWINAAPELFVDKNQLESQRFPKITGFDPRPFFEEAYELVLKPVVNRPVSIVNKFRMNTSDVKQMIFDFDQHIYDIYGPDSAKIEGFSAGNVANAFFVVFSLFFNQKRIDGFMRNLMDGIVLYSSFVQCSMFNSITIEFELTIEKYMKNPNTTDIELMLIIKRYHSIQEECRKLRCELLSSAFYFAEKTPVFNALINRFEQNNFIDGLKAWNELQKLPETSEKRCSPSTSFRERVMNEKIDNVKNEFPQYARFNTEVLHARETIKKTDDSIFMIPFFKTAVIFDAIYGSQRCVESKPISMSLLYSVLSFMLRLVDDPEMKKRNIRK